MQSDFELNMVGDIAYFPDFQVKIRKDYTYDYQGIYIGSSCTQLLWSSQMLGDVNRVVPSNMCDMLVIEFPIQRKDDLLNYELNNKLIQISESVIDVEANFQYICSPRRERLEGRKLMKMTPLQTWIICYPLKNK